MTDSVKSSTKNQDTTRTQIRNRVSEFNEEKQSKPEELPSAEPPFQTQLIKPSPRHFNNDYSSDTDSKEVQRNRRKRKRPSKHTRSPESDDSTDLTSTPYVFSTDSEEITFEPGTLTESRMGFHKKKLPRTYTLVDDPPPNMTNIHEPLFRDWNGLIFTKKQVDERESQHRKKKEKFQRQLQRARAKYERRQKERFYNSGSWACLVLAFQIVGMIAFSIIAFFLFRERCTSYILTHVRMLPDEVHNAKLDLPVCLYSLSILIHHLYYQFVPALFTTV